MPFRIQQLEEYVTSIEAFTSTRPDMVGVRTYNHELIGILDQLRQVTGKNLLDVGASPHGYALEEAMKRDVASYIGIGLGVPEDVEVRTGERVARLQRMDAEKLEFSNNSFDLIISLSTFEHFFDGARVLAEMFRVLKPGGSVLVSFQPAWTCSYGHHLHHYPPVANLIPPWAHLVWNETSMRAALEKKWSRDLPLSLDEAVNWVFKSSEINRVDIVSLRNMFHASAFAIEWMTPLVDEKTEEKMSASKYLSSILPYSQDDLMTLGYSILFNKLNRT
jgi:SAM-dependent methyltransferase